MRQWTVYFAVVIGFAILMACVAGAQTLNLWPGVAPGSENWKQQEMLIPFCYVKSLLSQEGCINRLIPFLIEQLAGRKYEISYGVHWNPTIPSKENDQ